jgi:hypothetical protein
MPPTVTFAKDTTSITLPAPEPGRRERAVRAQASGLTAAGTRVVADGGTERRLRTETFRNLTAAELADLFDFFHDTAAGMQETFTYTDSSGTAHTARFAAAELESEAVAAGVHDAVVPLEIE